MYPTHRTLYCDHCGKESDPRSEREPYEEDEILPGDWAGGDWAGGDQHLDDFVRLREHRATTGDHWWCMECWVDITTPEISSHWKDAYFEQKRFPRLGHIQLDDGSEYYIHQTFGLRRCSTCRQWLEVPNSCPVIETNRYTVLRGEAGKKIDGWFFGVLFKDSKHRDILCPKHLERGMIIKKRRQEHLRVSLAKMEERTRRAS